MRRPNPSMTVHVMNICERTYRSRLTLAIAILSLASAAASAQETIDPRTGQLRLEVTDLVVAAGPLTLDITRTFRSGNAVPGAVGRGWQLNWESTVHRSSHDAVVFDGGRATIFRSEDGEETLHGPSGERLHFEDGQRAIRSGPGGVTSLYEIHDGVGRLTRLTGPNGNTIQLNYSESGSLEQVEGPMGSSLDFTVDERGRVTRVVSSFDTVVDYSYVGDLLTAARVNGGPPENYFYDESATLVAIDRPATGRVDIEYDAWGRVIRRRWADRGEELFDYTNLGREVRQTHPTKGVTTYRWSEDGLRHEITDPLGHTAITEYDPEFRPVAITDPTGATTRYGYDTVGRVVQIAGPGDQITTLEYRGASHLLTAIHRPDGSAENFEYDQHGNLLAEKVNGTALRSYSYFPDGLVKSIRGLEFPELRFSYLPNGFLHTETDAMGQVTRYRYDDRGNLVSRTDAAGATTTWYYDERNRLVSETDAAGATKSYSYDQRDLPVTVARPSGGVTRFAYDARGRLASETDPLGRTSKYVYRPDGQLSRRVDPSGNTVRYEYDAAGRMVREIDALGGITEYAYNALDQVLAISDPGGSTWSYRYSDDGKLTKITTPSGFANRFNPSESRQEFVDPAGRLTRDLYNPLGQLTERQLPGGVHENYRYDDSGNLVEISTNTGLKATTTSDPLGRPLRVVLPTGLEIRNGYDEAGNLVRVEDSLGSAATMRYDPAGRVTQLVEADGATTRYRYDAAGRQVERIDPRGHSTRYTYDTAGQLISITGPGDETIGFEYDANGELAAVHLPGGGTTSFVRDALGNAVRTTDAIGNTVTRAFDSAGRLLRETNPTGRATTLHYDEAGRLSRKTRPDGVAVAYSYDVSGKVIEVDDGAFPVRYSYDDRGNQSQVSYPVLGRSLSFSYDERDRLTGFVDSEGRAVSYHYDPFDRMTNVVTPTGDEISIAYDAKDRPISIRYPNGITETWRYDTADRPLEIAYQDLSGELLAERRYSYDAAGNPVEVSDSRGRVTRYRYDRSDQLVEESGPWGFRRYSYRADGNRTSLTDDDGSVRYEYDAAGRLVLAGDESFGYDSRGNMVERRGPDGRTSYLFDAEDRLVGAVLPDGETIRFGYAPTGERIWREDAEGRSWFVTDGDHRLADLDEDLRLRASYLHGPWLDRPLMISSGEEPQWVLRDVLGSVIGLCDSAGDLTAESSMDAFGNRLTPAPASSHPFAFTAREYEPKLGLYYFRARYYDPRLGRFISADPLQSRLDDPLSANRYAYVRNAPTRFTDPMGLRAEQLWSADLPLPPPDESITALVNKMSQRYGTPAGRTARLVVEEYRHLQRLSDLQHRVPNPRGLPQIMREKPSLYDAAQRVKEQLELNKLFHRPGVDPRSPSSNLAGARKFLQLQRQKEAAEAVTSLRNRGSIPPDWAVKPRNTRTVGARAPAAAGNPTGAPPAGGSNAPPAEGSNLPVPHGGNAVVPAGGSAAATTGGAGAAPAPKGNPKYSPKPLSNTRGPWGPVTPRAPTAWEKFTKPPTAGQSFTLTLFLTNERILRCRDQGLTAGQCAEQFLKEVWEAKYEIGLFVTVAIVSPVAGTVVVGAFSVVKAVTDVTEVGYAWWDKRDAEKNLERILEDRKKWTDENIKNRYTEEMLRLEQKIRDTADELRDACAKLANTVDVMERGAKSVEAELKKKPFAADINAGADACRSLPEKEARLRSIRGEIGGLVDQAGDGADSAWRLAESCRSQQDGVKALELIRANDATLRKIEKAAAETEKIKGELDKDRDTIDTAQKDLRTAMDLRDLLIDTANAIHPLSATEAEVRRAEAAIDLLTDPPPSLGNDINNLIKAFGDFDDLPLEMIADFNQLRQLVREAQPLAASCKPADFLSRHREAADKIVRAKLSAQALVDQVDASPLADCGIGSLRSLAKEILETAERASGFRQFNEEAKKEARACLTKHGASTTQAGGGTGSGTSSSSSASSGEAPSLVAASSGRSSTGGEKQPPPLVDASKPGGPTTGGDPQTPPGVGASTAVKPQSGDEELVYANLDIELAQDDYGIYDILDNFKDSEIIIKTPQGDKQYLGPDAIKYLAQKGWIIHKSGVGWIATDRLKRFLGIGEPDEPDKPDKPDKPKGSGRPTIGGATFDAPLQNYNPDDPNTPEGKRKKLRELNDKCQRTAAWGEWYNCIWSCFGDECRDACSRTYEQNKPPICREAEALAAQLGSGK